jgi:hypothetical protein
MMQYKTYMKSELSRIIASQVKVKTDQSNWTFGYENVNPFLNMRLLTYLKQVKIKPRLLN